MPQWINLKSLIVLSHPGLRMCVSTQSRSHLILIQVSRFASHHPRCLDSRLFSIHVASNLNPDPYVYVSSPSMWRLTPTQDTKIASQLHISIPTTPSRIQDMCLTSTQVLFHLDPGSKILVSPPYMYCLNPIQVHVITSHLPPDSVSTHPCPDIYMSPQSRSRLTSTQVWRCMYTSINALSHLQPGHSPRLHFTSTHVLISQLLVPYHPIYVSRCAYVLYHLYPGHWIRISPPSMSRPNSNQVENLVSHLIPGRMSPPSRSRELHISSILVLSQPFHVSRYAA